MPEPGVLEALPRLRRHFDRVVVATARAASARAVTVAWLDEMGPEPDEVLVGPHVKFDALSCAHQYGSPVLVVDDDPPNAWLSEGRFVTIRVPAHPWTVHHPGLRHLVFSSWETLTVEAAPTPASASRLALRPRGAAGHPLRPLAGLAGVGL